MKVKLGDILEAFELNDRYSEYFLDQETGEVVQVNDMMMTQDEKAETYDRLDEHGFLRLPSDIHDFDIMGDFVDTCSGTRREKLLTAISGRSPFRNFKDEVRRMGIEKQWYDFQADAYRRKAIEWCEEHGVEYDP
jgi:hypothetical protein